MKKAFFKIVLLATILQSCSPAPKPETAHQKDKDKFKDMSLKIIGRIDADIILAKTRKEPVFEINIDSIQNEWSKIHQENPELGYIYLQKIDSIYLFNKAKITAEQKPNEGQKQEEEREKEAARERLAQSNPIIDAPWKDPEGSVLLNIAKIMVNNDITGCGEFYVKEVGYNAYIIACTRDGSTWKYYKCLPSVGKITKVSLDVQKKLIPPNRSNF